MITATGWTWEYIDENVTIPQVLDLFDYWRTYPPVHDILKARYLTTTAKALPEKNDYNFLMDFPGMTVEKVKKGGDI